MKNFKFATLLFLIFVSNMILAATNKIYINMNYDDFYTFRKSKRSIEFPNVQVKVNDGLSLKATLKVRGKSCLEAKRKCIGLKFEEKVQIGDKETGLNEKKYNLVSMWQDIGYVSNKIGFEFLNKTNMFKLKSQYTELYINNTNFGLYLLTEVPKNIMEKKFKSPLAIRRSYGGEFLFNEEFEKNGTKPTPEEEFFFGNLRSFYNQFPNYYGSNLIQFLNQNMNFDKYLSWLGLNYLIMNGDYTDEVFFYVDGPKYLTEKKVYFDFFPWDYDDIFKTQHDIKENKKIYKKNPDTLIYCFEDPIDKMVGLDSTVNYYYKQKLKTMLTTQVTAELINAVIDSVRNEISPYLDNREVLSQSRLDDGEPEYTKESILNLLEEHRNTLLTRRIDTLNRL